LAGEVSAVHSRLRAFVANTPIKLIAVILITILAPSVIVTALGLVAVLQADSFVRDRLSRPLREKMERLERRLAEEWSRRLGFYEDYLKDAPSRLSRLRDLSLGDGRVRDILISGPSGLEAAPDPPPMDLWSPEAEEELKEVHRLEVLERNYPLALAECQRVLSRAVDEAVVVEALLAAGRLSYLLRSLEDAERYLRSALERFGDTVDATGMVRAVPILCRIAEIEKEMSLPQRARETAAALEAALERHAAALGPEASAFFRRKLASLKEGAPAPAEGGAAPPRPASPARVPADSLKALEPLLARKGSAPGARHETHAVVPGLGEADFVTFLIAGGRAVHLLLDREAFRSDAALIASELGLPELGLEIASGRKGPAPAPPAAEVLASRLPPPFAGCELRGTLPREALPEGFRGFNVISLATFSWAVIVLVLAIVAGVLFTLHFVVRETRTARLKSDFVGFISHELKTPLTSIRMFTETMLSGRVEDEEERKFCIQMIDRESERLSKLIEQVLEYSRIERRQKEFKFTSCDMEDVVREAVRIFQDLHRKDPRDVEVNAVQRISKIRMDRAAMVELFLNLLSNAAKYSSREKKIVLNVRESIDDISVEVVDHGVGIKKRDQKKIFERFFRADDYLTRGVEGTGLGLTFARYIAKVHNGDIKVSSQPASGSTFTLQLRKSHVLAE
jgi:signal transduction histidine kinase